MDLYGHSYLKTFDLLELVPYVTNILNLTVVNFCKFLSADYISHRQNNDKVIKVLL